MQYQTAYEKYIFAIRAVRDISPTLADAIAEYVSSTSSRSDASEDYSLKPGDKCPKCGLGTVVLRTKSDPPFLGCSEFKNGGCRFSASCTREQAQQWIAEGRTGYKQHNIPPVAITQQDPYIPKNEITDPVTGKGGENTRAFPTNDLVNRQMYAYIKPGDGCTVGVEKDLPF